MIGVGVELDALIEEKVFGRLWELVPRVKINDQWRECPTWIRRYADETPEEMRGGAWAGQSPPRYSTSIEAAWTVVEQLRSEGWLIIVKEMPDGFPYLAGDDWTRDPKVLVRSYVSAQWMPRKTAEDTRRYIFLHPDGMGDTTPIAVCRCALRVRELVAKFGEEEAR